MNITDETLAAYADGELDGAEKERVAAAVAADPALAAKIEAHHALKARLAAHYAPLAEQAVPPHLAALLSGAQDKDEQSSGEVISFAAARQKRGLVPVLRRWGPIAGPALAASLVLAVLQPWKGSPRRLCRSGARDRARYPVGSQSTCRCRDTHSAQLRT